MKLSELLRLVWLNLNQNKFKTVMTSIGIIVGAATIVMMFAIGRGSTLDVAEQFSSLNAGAVDISYEYEGEENTSSGGGFSFGGITNMFSSFTSMFTGGGGDSSSAFAGTSGMAGMFSFGGGGAFDSSSADSGGGFSMGDFDLSDMGDFDTSQMGDFDMSEMGDFDASEMGDFDMEDMADMFDGSAEGDEEAAEGAEGSEGEDTAVEGENGEEAGIEGSTEEESLDAAEEDIVAEEAAEDAEAENPDAEEETEEDMVSDRMNQENIILTEEDVDDILTFVSGVSDATISYTSKTSVEGGNLTSAETYTVAGVLESYYTVSNLEMAEGEFITESDNDNKSRVCVLGSTAAKELFGSAEDAYGQTLYIDDRAYTVTGILKSTGTVSADITPDESVFVPYATGIKYITGESISPVITILAEDVNAVDAMIEEVKAVLEEKYSTAEFTYSDAGSKMEAAESSNQILTLMLTAMAVIVFVVGGIGIMNVLFVSVKERTAEIGVLKALGAYRRTILTEFLLESAAISMIGGVLGVAASFAITPIVEYYDIRVEATVTAWAAALLFSLLTGTVFGFYPAWKASKLVPVEALSSE